MDSKNGRSETKYIDGNKSRSKAKLLNQSCNPNAIFCDLIYDDNHKVELWIKSKSEIAAGDEIFVDY